MPPPCTILVVDDNAAALKATVRILVQAGYEVTPAADGAAALQHVRASQPNLVLLDIVLPDGSGLDVLRQIRANPALSGVAVVLLSAQQTTSEQQAEGLDAGADDYITRPVGNVELLARVRSHFRQRELTERLRASEREQRELAEKLEAERAKLIAAQSVAKVGSWETDLATLSVNWSLETHRIFETSPDEFQPTHQKFLHLVHPDDRVAVDEAFVGSFGRHEPCSIEHRLLMPDGRIKFLEERWAVIYDEAQRPVRAVGTCQDVSDRKQVEEESRLLADQLTTTLESITDAFFTVNQEWRFTFVNREAERLLGRTRADLIGRELWSEFPSTTGATFERECRRAMDEHQAVALEEFFPLLGIWISVRAYPSEQGLAVYFRDITASRRAAEALRISEERFRLLAKATSDAIWDWDVVSNALWWSEGYQNLFGYRRDETDPTLKSWTDYIHPDDFIRVKESIDHVIQGGGNSWTSEYRFKCKDGRYVYVYDQGEVIRDPAGKAVRMIGGMSDVTERKRAEEVLRASEVEFRALAEAMPQIVWVTRPDGWNIYFNQRWMDYTGLTLEESLGQGWTKPFHPDDQARAWEAWQRAMAIAGIYSIECRLRRADGNYLWWLIRGVPLKDADGRILKWFGTCTDIDDLKTAQDRIAEQAALIDEARDAIIVRDLGHRILFWSKGAERLHGWSADEARGHHVQELLLAEKAPFAEAARSVLVTGVWNGEIRKTAKNGVEHILNCGWTLLRDAQGQPKSILSFDTDVTEQKKIEQQFLRAQRMESIGTLAGGIAHDLNNLLAPIIMGVELLKQGESAPENLQIIDTIERSAQRGSSLVKQVLSFARGVEGSRIAVQVRHLVRDLESILANTFPKNISVETDFAPGLRLIMADPTQLNQVLLNLCVNARDAMPDGGRLVVAARNIDIDPQYAVMDRGVAPGKYVVIEVTDSGYGMPREIIDRIFEPFFTTKEFGKGTGLGLSTVQGIMRSHGGFVNVYSELGKGSVFKVYLPALEEGANENSAARENETLPRGNGETIMVVDDESSILNITKQTLLTFGYKVVIAEDGAQAIGLYAIHRHEIAVVLTDMMMPVMDGQALIFALRRVNPNVRIIAASGLMAHDNLTRAANTGVKHFLAKPYSAGAMLTLLKKVLGEREGESSPVAR